MKNPYKKTIIDESSGVEVSNDRYTDWQLGYDARTKEINKKGLKNGN